MFVTEDIRYIGVNDHDVDLFEGQYTVENGMSYNSYVILDAIPLHLSQKYDCRLTLQLADQALRHALNLLEAPGYPDFLFYSCSFPFHP